MNLVQDYYVTYHVLHNMMTQHAVALPQSFIIYLSFLLYFEPSLITLINESTCVYENIHKGTMSIRTYRLLVQCIGDAWKIRACMHVFEMMCMYVFVTGESYKHSVEYTDVLVVPPYDCIPTKDQELFPYPNISCTSESETGI
jgi:hypothetical protein